MKNNPVVWFEIYVQEMERAKQFYESVFQVKLERLNTPDLEMWGFPNPATDGGEAEIEIRQLFELDDFEPSGSLERFREMGIGEQ